MVAVSEEFQQQQGLVEEHHLRANQSAPNSVGGASLTPPSTPGGGLEGESGGQQ